MNAEVALVVEALEHRVGMPPMPFASVAPSGIREATLRATRMCNSVKGSVQTSSKGRDVSTIEEMWLMWMDVSP